MVTGIIINSVMWMYVLMRGVATYLFYTMSYEVNKHVMWRKREKLGLCVVLISSMIPILNLYTAYWLFCFSNKSLSRIVKRYFEKPAVVTKMTMTKKKKVNKLKSV